jgi:hypothetical protein
MSYQDAKNLHDTIGFVGLRVQATVVCLLQLSTELRRAGVLGEDAIDRIKDAILGELALSRPRSVSKEDYNRSMRQRLDRLFSGDEPVGEAGAAQLGSGSPSAH